MVAGETLLPHSASVMSSTRGDLGAIQNRLEYTQNNLSVMTENIQDAESSICTAFPRCGGQRTKSAQTIAIAGFSVIPCRRKRRIFPR